MTERPTPTQVVSHLAEHAQRAKAAQEPFPMSSVATTYSLVHGLLELHPLAALYFADAAFKTVNIRILEDIHGPTQAPEEDQEADEPPSSLERIITSLSDNGYDPAFLDSAMNAGIAFGEALYAGTPIDISEIERTIIKIHEEEPVFPTPVRMGLDAFAEQYISEVKTQGIFSQLGGL